VADGAMKASDRISDNVKYDQQKHLLTFNSSSFNKIIFFKSLKNKNVSNMFDPGILILEDRTENLLNSYYNSL